MVLPGSKRSMGSLIYLGNIVSTAVTVVIAMLLVACSSSRVEIHTTSSVTMYSMPTRPDQAGNRAVGVIPAGVTLPVERQILQKDHAAYEVEYKSGPGRTIRGFVILGHGFDVRTVGTSTGQ